MATPPRSSRVAQAEGEEINGSRPQLETEGAIQACCDADAAYEQAFNDLVKADALAASDQELMQKQQAVREAKAAREEADARLAEIQRTIEDGRRQTEEKRRAILDEILPIRRLRTRPNALLPSLAGRALQIPKSRNASVRRSSDSPTSRRRGGAEHRAVRAERTRSLLHQDPRRASRPHGSAKARSTTRNQKETPANGTCPSPSKQKRKDRNKPLVARSEVEQAIAARCADPGTEGGWRLATPMQCARWCRRSRRRGQGIAAQDGVAATGFRCQ